MQEMVHTHRRVTQGTWPSGIEAPLAEDGPFECLDYVYLWEARGVTCRCVVGAEGDCKGQASVVQGWKNNTTLQDTVGRAQGRASGGG